MDKNIAECKSVKNKKKMKNKNGKWKEGKKMANRAKLSCVYMYF